MGELVAWGLGLGLGYAIRHQLTSRSRIVLAVIAVLVLGASITLMSGELWSAPWLVLLDIGQVAIAALLGVLVVPHAIDWLHERSAKALQR